jgi:DNA-binding HxlR family transcriptional regulator
VAGKRRYGQGCPVAHALDMIGERWALLVVRELRLGPRRYADLQAALPDAGPSVLSQRLRDLEEVGVLQRRTLPPPAGSRVYELTGWGAELEPVFRALARWGVRSPVVPLEGAVSADSVMLGMRTFFDSHTSPPWTATYEIRLERESYRIAVVDGRLTSLSRRETGEADVTVHTDQSTWESLLSGTRSLPSVIESGLVIMDGDAGAVERLIHSARPPAASAS